MPKRVARARDYHDYSKNASHLHSVKSFWRICKFIVDQGWLHGQVTSAVSTGAGSQKGPKFGLMFCSYNVAILNNFNFEFIFCKWSPMGLWWVCWSFKPQLMCGPAFLGWVFGYLLPTSRALLAPSPSGSSYSNCFPLPRVAIEWHWQG